MANDPIKLVDVGALDRFKTDIENEIPDSVQYSTMPTASADLVGSIVQFTGTTGTYHNGYFYKCQDGSTSGTYEWVTVSVQPGGGGSSVQSDWNQTDNTADDYIKNKPTALPASDTTSSYSASGTAPVNGTAVAAAIGELDVSSVGGSGKYIQSISETDGKISATAVDVPGFLEQIYKTMPEASSEYYGKVVQYVYNTQMSTGGFKHGEMYTCDSSYGEQGTTYSWVSLYTDTISQNGSKPVRSSAVYAALQDKVDKNGTDRLMTANEGTKLSGIATGATANTIIDTSVTISTSDWSGSSAPYTATKSVSGILSTDTPIIDIVVSSTTSTGIDQIESYGYISRAVTSNGSITFYCYESKPTVSLPIKIKIIR